jgi:hypothetical protein
MELEAIPVQTSKGMLEKIFQNRAKPEPTEQLNLYLTIQFNEQWESLPGGRIKFGLRGGELRLKLENGEIPLKNRELAGALELVVQKERQQQEGSETQSSLEATCTDNKPGVKANINEKKTAARTDKFQFDSYQVTPKGSDENPAWVFEVKTGEPVLKCLLKNAKLGVLHVIDKPCRLEATFEVTLKDVRLTEGEGLWLSEISPTRRKILDMGLANLFLKRKLQPYLSRLELRYV